MAITGQDADLAAVKRIMAGTQTMTVYKPISKLADEAASIAVQLGKGEKPKSNATLNNGVKPVPAWLLTPIPVDKSNIDSTIIADGSIKKPILINTDIR
ncbi:D-xylose-binding periplasmic protein precursor [Serratia plymuthica]|uniref:D-xylose-binding periplasmic protein n=1 Tax=Serratia plymuthica TaxID=82996 RepID=A0A2X4WQC2_SERPL|nr:D-xylose-binding periplasmic protein precursor [Serratia plymuthica]